MRRLPFSLISLLALTIACAKDATFAEPPIPRAAITWLNAVSDTGQLDFRLLDMPTNAGFPDANFRSVMMYPQGIEAGTHHIVVFQSDSLPQNSQVHVLDTTFTFQADQSYSFKLVGFSRTGQTPRIQAVIETPTVPTLAAGQFAIRVMNFAPSLAGAAPALADTTVAPDAFVRKTSTLPGGTPEIANVAYGQTSAYVALDTGRFYTISLAATGSGGPVIAQAALPRGQAGNTVNNPIGGSLVAGTVMTAIILPRSTPATKAPQTRPALRNTDATASEATRRVTRSNDTVTVQVGSISVLTNRSQSRADSVVASTGTGASAGVNPGDVVFVSGATQPEYNEWHAVIAGSGTPGAALVADTLVCAPTSGTDTASRCSAANVTATTRFRFKYKIAGTPVSPGTTATTIQYRFYPALAAADFGLPFVTFVLDKRPPSTAQ